ncbi:hypothetical protein J6590_081027 [Homalodisca vitripennis]|nr:hypothetical protein J6590_081027 [Homalodisca vitripennis]
MSKCALKRGRDIHRCETRGRDNYRTGRHYEHLPSQVGVYFINRLPVLLRLSKAFFNVDELLADNGGTAFIDNMIVGAEFRFPVLGGVRACSVAIYTQTAGTPGWEDRCN